MVYKLYRDCSNRGVSLEDCNPTISFRHIANISFVDPDELEVTYIHFHIKDEGAIFTLALQTVRIRSWVYRKPGTPEQL